MEEINASGQSKLISGFNIKKDLCPSLTAWNIRVVAFCLHASNEYSKL